MTLSKYAITCTLSCAYFMMARNYVLCIFFLFLINNSFILYDSLLRVEEIYTSMYSHCYFCVTVNIFFNMVPLVPNLVQFDFFSVEGIVYQCQTVNCNWRLVLVVMVFLFSGLWDFLQGGRKDGIVRNSFVWSGG